jgi:hypothetical protein
VAFDSNATQSLRDGHWGRDTSPPEWLGGFGVGRSKRDTDIAELPGIEFGQGAALATPNHPTQHFFEPQDYGEDGGPRGCHKGFFLVMRHEICSI